MTFLTLESWKYNFVKMITAFLTLESWKYFRIFPSGKVWEMYLCKDDQSISDSEVWEMLGEGQIPVLPPILPSYCHLPLRGLEPAARRVSLWHSPHPTGLHQQEPQHPSPRLPSPPVTRPTLVAIEVSPSGRHQIYRFHLLSIFLFFKAY